MPSWNSRVFNNEKSLYNRKPLSTRLGGLGRGERQETATTAARAAVLDLTKRFGKAGVEALVAAMNLEPKEEPQRDEATNRQDRRVPEPAKPAGEGAGE